MSSIEEINKQIEKVVEEIEEVQTAIKTLENDLVTKTNDYDFWKKRLEQLGDEKNKLRDEKNKLRDEKKQLRDKELLLLQRQSESEKLHLYNILSLVPPKVNDKNETKSGSTASRAAKYVKPVYLLKWPSFGEHFANFQLKIKETSEKQNMRIYSNVEFDEEVSSGSEISTQMFHKEFLNEIFERRIFSKSNLFFGPPDNGTKVKSDIYWKERKETEKKLVHFFSEVKTSAALKLPAENVADLIFRYGSEIPTTNAIKQLITYSTFNKQIFSILTNHEVTYCFRINEENDVTGRDVARVYVSDPISRENQIMAVFFILLLRYPQLTPNGFKECIEEVLLKVNEDLGKHIEQGPLNKTQNLNLKSDNNERKRKRNGKQPNGQEHSDYTKLELDIYKHYKDDAEVFYSNENYVLAKFVKQGKEFVIKCCDLFNSSKEARDEIRNEMRILEFINNELVTKSELRKFFPTKKYVGTIGIFLMIVIDYIDGKCYDEFGDMPDRVKMACRRSIEHLHKLGIAHGDIRAPNFIIRNLDSDPVAVVIDFGRSEIVKNTRRSRREAKQMLEEEFKQFCLDLDPNSSQDSDEKYVSSDQSMNFEIQEYEYEQISQAVDCI